MSAVITFTPYISGEVLESFQINITINGSSYISKPMTGLDCPADFKGVCRLGAYMACLEYAKNTNNFEIELYENGNKLSAIFVNNPDNIKKSSYDAKAYFIQFALVAS